MLMIKNLLHLDLTSLDEEYKNVYISAVMTKYQRAKHKQLVEELKCRKAANEPNLTIRNGVIVTKHPYRGNQGNNSQPNSNHQQRSETQNCMTSF